MVSIVGRALLPLGLGPVPGDLELVEAGAALAVVDLFWKSYPPPMQRVLEIFSDALMLIAWLLLVWRMGVSGLEYRENQAQPGGGH